VGVVCLFRYDFRWGLVGSLSILVLGPAVFFMALQVFPSTPIGRKIINAPSTEDGPPPELSALAKMVDSEGEALTDLRPGGFVHIPSAGPDGKRVAAMSEVAFIQAGTRIRITAADGMQVRVRPVA
jgi:membrane-bound ClpP family serine protease